MEDMAQAQEAMENRSVEIAKEEVKREWIEVVKKKPPPS